MAVASSAARQHPQSSSSSSPPQVSSAAGLLEEQVPSRVVTTPVRELSDVTLYFLQHELTKYFFERKFKQGSTSSTQQQLTGPAKPLAAAQNVDSTLMINGGRDFAITLLEDAGFNIGLRLQERLTLSRNRLWEPRESLKFICKDLWGFLFQKQADRLQTNRKGGYVIMDMNFPPLRYVPKAHALLPRGKDESVGVLNNIPLHQSPAAYLAYVCGIIRGALSNLGISCSVASESSTPPACSFQIRLDS